MLMQGPKLVNVSANNASSNSAVVHRLSSEPVAEKRKNCTAQSQGTYLTHVAQNMMHSQVKGGSACIHA